MDERQTKRIRKAAVDSSLKQKLQNLPLLCVEAICKVTPTARLIRLYSTAAPLPGASWNFGLEAALKKRKISISQDPSYDQYGDTRIDALFDYSGANVATIKHPEAFHLSPLCEFVQSVAVPFRVLPSFAVAEPRLRCVVSGQPLLPHLPNIRKLTLVDLGPFEKPYPSETLDGKDFLLPILKEVLPQIESFTFQKTGGNQKMPDHTLVELLPEMTVLKRLYVPPVTFDILMRAANAGPKESEALWHVLCRLNSVILGQRCFGASTSVQLLNFMSGCCTRLTRLSLLINGELEPYLMALRTFANLTVLGLELVAVNTKGMTFTEGEAVTSVLELRLAHEFSTLRPHVKDALASLFPHVQVAELHYEAYTAELCGKRIWPHLEKLACFPVLDHRQNLPSPQFLACRNLPSVVDLSPIIDEDLAHDSGALTAIYQAVQSGPIKTLLLRGPLHREALQRLQAYIDLNSQSAKITAWKDQDLGEQTSITGHRVAFVPATEFSRLTDVTIVGTKENGGNFSIRVVHQHTENTNIFD